MHGLCLRTVPVCHIPGHGYVVLLIFSGTPLLERDHATGVPQASYAEDDSPQLSEDDDADGAAAAEDGGEEYMARAALGLRTKPRKVLSHVIKT